MFTLWLVVQSLADPKCHCELTLLVLLWSPTYHLGLDSSPYFLKTPHVGGWSHREVSYARIVSASTVEYL